MNAFLPKFNPSDELRKAFSDFLEPHALCNTTGQLGCCYFPGPILILYTLKGTANSSRSDRSSSRRVGAPSNP